MEEDSSQNDVGISSSLQRKWLNGIIKFVSNKKDKKARKGVPYKVTEQ